MTREADEAAVVYLELEGLINQKEATGLRRKIKLTRKWLGRHVWIEKFHTGGWVRTITTKDWWGNEIWVDCSFDGRQRPFKPEELELST